MTPILFGLFAMPLGASEGFLSSILGDRVLANTKTKVTFYNSQNMALLQTNTYSALIFKNENNTKGVKNSSQAFDSNNTVIIDGKALKPTISPLSVTGGVEYFEISSEDISIYIVRKGDSLSQIAEMFDVSVNTILWANDLKRNEKIGIGDILFILPVSGVKHIITKGQTLSKIAKLYKVNILTITGFNGISKSTKLKIGDELIIPEAQMPTDDVANKSSGSKSKPSLYYATGKLKNVSGYFINPVPDFKRKSQGLHGPGYRGIDLAARTGKRVLASANGQVLLARKGYNGGYGYMVIIQHPNGTKTLYAHLSRITTKTGAQVSQGGVVGYIGSTGRSTGPHLHFEVFNAKNPGSDWSWAK